MYPTSASTAIALADTVTSKHMKRHTKPYGCTDTRCNKRFGSRNDWKRHDRTQHVQEEAWRCEIAPSRGAKCGQFFRSREEMISHLKTHNSDRELTRFQRFDIDTMADAFHLGHGGSHHFWCGFCDQLIALEASEISECDQRYKHIGDHFDKEYREIGDWIDVEENKKKRYLPHRKTSGNSITTTESSDDSDLGDDGIGLPKQYSPSFYGMGMHTYLDDNDDDQRGTQSFTLCATASNWVYSR